MGPPPDTRPLWPWASPEEYQVRLEEARRTLASAYAASCTLTLVLMALDDSLSHDARREALSSAEDEMRDDSVVTAAVEAVMYARPLPASPQQSARATRVRR